MRLLMGGANGAHVRLGPGCALELVSSSMCPTYVLGIAHTPLNLGMAGSRSEPMSWDEPNFVHMVALVCQAQEDLLARSKVC